MRLYTCVCVCVCIFVHRFGSWYQCFSVWTVSCMRMWFRVHMYAYTYVCGYIYMCIFLQWVLHALYRCFGHQCMGRSVCYTGVFLHQRTHLRTHSLQVVHICVYVYMCIYACICIWMRMCVYDIAWHVEALLLRFSICTYMYICMSVYMYAYTVIYARVWVYICTRVDVFWLFVLSNLSITCACITGVS